MLVSGSAAACAKVSDFGLAADDAFVDQVEFRIGAGADDGAGVEHFVAGLEQGYLRPDRIDHAGGVVAQHLGRLAGTWRARMRTLVSTGLTDTALTATRRSRAAGHRGVGGEIDQAVRRGDRQGFEVADSFHEVLRARMRLHMAWPGAEWQET